MDRWQCVTTLMLTEPVHMHAQGRTGCPFLSASPRPRQPPHLQQLWRGALAVGAMRGPVARATAPEAARIRTEPLRHVSALQHSAGTCGDAEGTREEGRG